MRQVPDLVYHWRWALWVPWVASVLVWVIWATEPVQNDLPLVELLHFGWALVWYFYRQQEAGPFSYDGLEGVLGVNISGPIYRGSGQVWYLLLLGLWVTVFVVALIAFVRSKGGELPARRRPRFGQIAAAGLMVGAIMIGLGAVLAEYFEVWVRVTHSGRTVGTWWGGTAPEPRPWGAPLLLLALWACASIGLLFGWRRRERYWRLESLTRWLVIGSIALMGVAVVGAVLTDGDPWYVFLADRGGIYTGFALGWTVLLWSWAARVLLLHRLRRFERARAKGDTCFACDYNLTGTLAAGHTACPECGAQISQAQWDAHSRATEGEDEISDLRSQENEA